MHDKSRDAAGQPVVHFVLSDGLASVSVYVESDPQEGLEGATRIGAVHAAGDRVSGHQVTVVGEVPVGDRARRCLRVSVTEGGAAVIEEIGVVVAVQGDMAEVEGQRRSDLRRLCRQRRLRHLADRPLSRAQAALLRAHNAIGAGPGDRVVWDCRRGPARGVLRRLSRALAGHDRRAVWPASTSPGCSPRRIVQASSVLGGLGCPRRRALVAR